MKNKWIEFNFVKDTGKTKVYSVVAIDGCIILGVVKWYSPWRKYSFFPEPDTVFERDCLGYIIDLIEELMLERRNKRVLDLSTKCRSA